MDTFVHFFTSGHAVDVVLVLMSLETAGILIYRRRTGYGVTAEELLGILIPGIWLLLALRGALAGGGVKLIAACLIAALVAHLLDLARRWQRVPGPTATRRTTVPTA